MSKRWFFTLSESSIDRQDHGWRGLIRVAVESAKQNTTLEPFLIYDGKENDFTSELRSRGVTIIHHRVSFYDELAKKDKVSPGYLPIASGAFLRVDLPLLDLQSEYVLYTDCDVIFLKDVHIENFRPKTFSAAPQVSMTDYSNDMNTGVMVLNLPRLREDLPAFTQYIVDHLNDGWPGCDQENYRRFYNGDWGQLPLEMNWKPHWGKNVEASIVHWHGPKPAMVRNLRSDRQLKTNKAWRELYERSADGYDYFLQKWDEIAEFTPKTLFGFVDVLTESVVAGWVLSQDDVNQPMELAVEIDGRNAGTLLCNGFRSDLHSLYHSSVGGFSLQLPDWVSSSDGEVKLIIRAGDGGAVPLTRNGSLKTSFTIREQLEVKGV